MPAEHIIKHVTQRHAVLPFAGEKFFRARREYPAKQPARVAWWRAWQAGGIEKTGFAATDKQKQRQHPKITSSGKIAQAANAACVAAQNRPQRQNEFPGRKALTDSLVGNGQSARATSTEIDAQVNRSGGVRRVGEPRRGPCARGLAPNFLETRLTLRAGGERRAEGRAKSRPSLWLCLVWPYTTKPANERGIARHRAK